jgi:hypothetical protein
MKQVSKFELQAGINVGEKRRHVARETLGHTLVHQAMGKRLRVKLLAIRRIYNRQNYYRSVLRVHRFTTYYTGLRKHLTKKINWAIRGSVSSTGTVADLAQFQPMPPF